MVKLIALKGDSTISRQEIRGTFREPVIVEPKSRVALVGCEVDLLNIDGAESFEIVSGTTFEVDGLSTVTLPVGIYSKQQFIELMTIYTPLQGFFTAGVDLVVTYQSGKLQFEKFKFRNEPQDFDEDYQIDGGNATSTTFTGPGRLFSDATFPNASYSIQFTVSAVAEGNISVFDLENLKIISGINIDNTGFYRVVFNDAVVSITGVQALADDVVTIVKERTEMRVRVTRSGGGPFVVNDTQTLTATLWDDYFSQGKTPVFYIEAIGALQITNARGTLGDGRYSQSTTLKLLFDSPLLADYLGWDDVGPHSDYGDPAQLIPPNALTGDDKYPGIQIVLDPFVLESYVSYTNTNIGQINSGPQSIIYVIHDIAKVGGEVAINVPTPVPLSVKNNQSINLNQLRIRFRNSTTNTDLQFQGSPAITLAIYGPDE